MSRPSFRAAYDPDVDALSLDLYAGARRSRTVPMGRGILAHFDRRMRLIELEILGASAHLSCELLERLKPPRQR
jgi:uncharacterized protein YuzE